MPRIKITVERISGYCNLPVQVGNHFFVEGSRLIVPEGQPVCLWALQSMMPVLPILAQRDRLEAGHWVRKVSTFSCPDPKGLVQYRLELVDEDEPPGPEAEAEARETSSC